jgi:CRP-like cAMP-binding protein
MSTEAQIQNYFSTRAGRAIRQGPSANRHGVSANEPTASVVAFAQNAVIFREGDSANRLYLYKVVSGTVRTCKLLNDGRRPIGAFYLPRDTFGFELGEEHAFSAEAVTEVKLRVTTLSQWENEVLLALVGSELQRSQDHILLLAKTARERVASFLLEMAERIRASDEVELPMSRQDVADYLGLTIETVSRTLAQFAHESVIALPNSRRIVLRNRTVLNKLTVMDG